jgi:hypothetical protein
VWRWLAEDAIRPWAWRSWVFARDPDFRANMGLEDVTEGRAWIAYEYDGARLDPVRTQQGGCPDEGDCGDG